MRRLVSLTKAWLVAAMLAWGLVFLARSGHVWNGLIELAKAAPIAVSAIAILLNPHPNEICAPIIWPLKAFFFGTTDICR